MSIRKNLSEAAILLKQESGKTYDQICGEGDITRSQLSAILKGKKGVSIELIETLFKEVFDVEVEVSIVQKLN